MLTELKVGLNITIYLCTFMFSIQFSCYFPLMYNIRLLNLIHYQVLSPETFLLTSVPVQAWLKSQQELSLDPFSQNCLIFTRELIDHNAKEEGRVIIVAGPGGHIMRWRKMMRLTTFTVTNPGITCSEDSRISTFSTTITTESKVKIIFE